MAAKRVKRTRLDIIRCASKFFLEQGYSVTTPKHICQELDIYTGNLTYYFHTKEQLLAVFVEMLCNFQWEMMEHEAQEGISSVMAICLELATMAAMCEENAVAKDFYLSSYHSDLCLEIIQKNDVKRSMQVFRDFRPQWTKDQFAEAEMLVSGIELSILRTNSLSPSLELRIKGALEAILGIYGVQEETRKTKIQKVLAMDYRALGHRVLQEFKDFVQRENEHALEALLRGERKKV